MWIKTEVIQGWNQNFRSQFCKLLICYPLAFSMLLKVISATQWQLFRVCHLRHKLRIFLFHRKDISVFEIFKFLYFQLSHDLLNLWRHDEYNVMMSISTRDKVLFWFLNIHWNRNSLTHHTWSIDRYKHGKYFPEIFWTIWRNMTKFQALFNLATCSNYSITNHVKFPVFHFF